jgi:hypothetical protein
MPKELKQPLLAASPKQDRRVLGWLLCSLSFFNVVPYQMFLMPLAQHVTASFDASTVTLGLCSMLLPGMHLIAPIITKVLRDRAHVLLTGLSAVGCFLPAFCPNNIQWFIVSMSLVGLGWVRTNINVFVQSESCGNVTKLEWLSRTSISFSSMAFIVAPILGGQLYTRYGWAVMSYVAGGLQLLHLVIAVYYIWNAPKEEEAEDEEWVGEEQEMEQLTPRLGDRPGGDAENIYASKGSAKGKEKPEESTTPWVVYFVMAAFVFNDFVGTLFATVMAFYYEQTFHRLPAFSGLVHGSASFIATVFIMSLEFLPPWLTLGRPYDLCFGTLFCAVTLCLFTAQSLPIAVMGHCTYIMGLMYTMVSANTIIIGLPNDDEAVVRITTLNEILDGGLCMCAGLVGFALLGVDPVLPYLVCAAGFFVLLVVLMLVFSVRALQLNRQDKARHNKLVLIRRRTLLPGAYQHPNNAGGDNTPRTPGSAYQTADEAMEDTFGDGEEKNLSFFGSLTSPLGLYRKTTVLSWERKSSSFVEPEIDFENLDAYGTPMEGDAPNEGTKVGLGDGSVG